MFVNPLRITARKDVFWSVSASDLPVRASGATPREAVDGLVSSLVDAVEVIQRREPSEGDPMVSLFSEYIDLNKPCPDPDATTCGS